jgi:asparagine synthase (glutamine-hydrolysing)
MCGINGVLRLRSDATPVEANEVRRTRDHLRTRGPDGVGEWFSACGNLGLGHRRLAIIDLSQAANQPMSGGYGRYWIVFNGEIYNYRQLRVELSRDHTFRTQSDTEVILALIARSGPKGLARLRGMFALAVWDDLKKTLLLARDPNGIKPLYYSADGMHFRFASQVKALMAGGAVASRSDPAAWCGFLLWGAVPEPRTTYESVKAVPAGHFMVVEGTRVGAPEPLPCLPDREEGALDLLTAIDESVGAHLVSDVPVAIFLSAGLDSAAVAALARPRLATPPTTITLRFQEFAGSADDEGPLAAECAHALGTQHVERWVSREEFLAGWDAVLAAMDQPSVDGLNTYWVCKAAHEVGVKVALSGLGGDELLGSYPSFRDVPRWQRLARFGTFVPGIASAWPRLAHLVRPKRPKLQGFFRYGATLEGSYFLRRAVFLPEELPALLGEEFARQGLGAYDPVRGAASVLTHEELTPWEVVQALETRLYLRNQLLRDSDWASMAHSVELRVPFVDAPLQRAASRSRFALPRSTPKSEIVRRLAPRIPEAIFERRKTGFGMPAAQWIGAAHRANVAGGSRDLAKRILRAFAT